MNSYKENSIRTFDEQAETYDHQFTGRHARKLYPYLLSQLHPLEARDILDLGCGTGELLQLLLDHRSDVNLYGLDIAEKMLKEAAHKLKGKVVLTLGDAEHMPYEDNSFDVVYCNDSFHHYPDPKRALQEIRRVLRPQGVFLLSDCYAPIGIRQLMNAFLPYGKQGDVRIYSKREIKKLLDPIFVVESWERLTMTAYSLTAQVKSRKL